MLLPGPEAMQLATYTGWRLHGMRGGLAAGLLFVLPGAAVVLALALIYSLLGDVPLVMTIFYGVKAAVVVIVVEALLRIARRALRKSEHWLLAGLSFAGIFFLALPFPLIVAVAAAWGFLGGQGGNEADGVSVPARVSHARTMRTIAVWLAIWWLPIGALMLVPGPGDILAQLALFFSKLAVVTFGGAYAVLAYMADTVVTRQGWLEAGQMLDGLGLAETTPGPLILVTEFVGFMAAFRQGGGIPVVWGVLGAIVALWTTFVPCFLWIFAGAPYIDWLNTRPASQIGTGGNHGRCGRRHPQSRLVVRAARLFHRRLQKGFRIPAVLGSRSVDTRLADRPDRGPRRPSAAVAALEHPRGARRVRRTGATRRLFRTVGPPLGSPVPALAPGMLLSVRDLFETPGGNGLDLFLRRLVCEFGR